MPIFTALFTGIAAIAGSVSTFFAGLGAFGSALLKIGLSIGLNLLSQALAGKPKPPGFSVQGRLQSGGDLPRSFLLGNCATAGSLVYANGWGDAGGAPNGYLTQVIALSDKPVSGINNLWVNGEKVTVLWAEPDDDGMGFPVEEYRKDGKDHLWINFYDGTQTAADPFMVSTVSRPEDGREYGADRIGYGMAYAIMHARVHDELWTGFPNFKFELRGLALYDISQDTTAGGDGDQRWDDPSTWGGPGDLLPAVQLYNILRGITDYGGGWLYGLQGLTAARLPAGNWIAAIGKCSLEIAGPEGSGVEPQYRAGGDLRACVERLGGSGAPAVDTTKEAVDGGRGYAGISEGTMKAAKKLREAQQVLGWQSYRLVRAIVCDGLNGSLIAQQSALKIDRKAVQVQVRHGLEQLAILWGYLTDPSHVRTKASMVAMMTERPSWAHDEGVIEIAYSGRTTSG